MLFVIVMQGKRPLMYSDFDREILEGMRMLMSFEIQPGFSGIRNFFCLRGMQSGLFFAVIIITIAGPLNNAVAQFPGVGSEAPSGVATTTNNEVSSDAAYGDTSAVDAGYSEMVGNTVNGSSNPVSQSNYDGDDPGYRSSDSGISSINLKNKYHRKQLFVKKLRLEFAAIELVERKTGLPFSPGDVPRYLDALRSDLETMVSVAENGKSIEGAMKSVARDAYFIEAHLNEHLDQLLNQAGQFVTKRPFFAITPPSPRANRISGAEIDALSLKFELAEYGKKVLQAMGPKR